MTTTVSVNKRLSDSTDTNDLATATIQSSGLAHRLFRARAGEAIFLREGTLDLSLGESSRNWGHVISGLVDDGVLEHDTGGVLTKNVNGFGNVTFAAKLSPLAILQRKYGLQELSSEEQIGLAQKVSLTTGEAADLLGVSQQTVIRQFDNGAFDAHGGFKVPGSKFRRITPAGLVSWIKSLSPEDHPPKLPRHFVETVMARAEPTK